MSDYFEGSPDLMVMAFAVCPLEVADEAGAILRQQLLAAHPFHLGEVACRTFNATEAADLLATIGGANQAPLSRHLAAHPDHHLVMAMLPLATLPDGQA